MKLFPNVMSMNELAMMKNKIDSKKRNQQKYPLMVHLLLRDRRKDAKTRHQTLQSTEAFITDHMT